MSSARANALTVTCPRCDAAPAQPCTGHNHKPLTRAHQERHDEYRLRPQQPPQRDVRPYDLEPVYLDDDNWTPKPMIEVPGGGLAYPLDDDTRERGLRNINEIRRQIAQRKGPR
jgi:hypothetical protein